MLEVAAVTDIEFLFSHSLHFGSEKQMSKINMSWVKKSCGENKTEKFVENGHCLLAVFRTVCSIIILDFKNKNLQFFSLGIYFITFETQLCLYFIVSIDSSFLLFILQKTALLLNRKSRVYYPRFTTE